jgi:hypothetical protein
MKYLLLPIILVCQAFATEKSYVLLKETFDTHHPQHFLTELPNKNTSFKKGVMWTRGESGRKYPPMVYMPLSEKDIEISFKYRHLGDGGNLWLFIDGDDGFGGTDHMLRIKFLRHGIRVQVDGHSLNPDAKGRQHKRKVDPKSGAYRLNEILPLEKTEIKTDEWQVVHLRFKGEQVEMSLNGDVWNKTLIRPGFKFEKQKILFMQNGGEQGIEIDDVIVKRVKT